MLWRKACPHEEGVYTAISTQLLISTSCYHLPTHLMYHIQCKIFGISFLIAHSTPTYSSYWAISKLLPPWELQNSLHQSCISSGVVSTIEASHSTKLQQVCLNRPSSTIQPPDILVTLCSYTRRFFVPSTSSDQLSGNSFSFLHGLMVTD